MNMTINLKELFEVNEHLNEKVVQKLLIALKSGHGNDFDYLKFKKSFLALKEMGMGEEIAIKSAFTTATTMGFTKEKLTENIRQYKVLLNTERTQFAQALKHQIAVNIDSKAIDISKLNDKKKINERKIIELKNQRQVIENEIAKLNQEIETNTAKIHHTRDQFKESYDYIIHIIEADEQKFNEIL